VYTLLRALAGAALRWFYRDIQVEGLERIPRGRPLLLVVNHPNALVDALLVIWIVPRRVLITAKAPLFANPLAGALLRWLGVVPLHRASDATATDRVDPSRNRETFRAVHDALQRGGTVLIFPEGKTHDEPSLSRLKTGAARMALHASEAGDVPGLAVVPIGLTFEQKDAPRTRVFAQVGEPIEMDAWTPPAERTPAEALTAEVDARLRAVTLNYSTIDDATRTVRLAALIAALFDVAPPIGAVGRGLGVETAIARRIEDLSARLPRAGATLQADADVLVARLDALRQLVRVHGVRLEDVDISIDRARAARFVFREGWLLLVAGPIAIWGRINHWIPFRAARLVAAQSVESAADPAMRTLVAGVAFVLLTYLAQTAAVWMLWGPVLALVYLSSLPLAAEINFYSSERLTRALQRARAYFQFRRDPGLHVRLAGEIATLRADVLTFERALQECDRNVIA
jgi:glycerol-3-phosphate O-acyltransferase / dihydroxyacetone phosphate acyltransferase